MRRRLVAIAIAITSMVALAFAVPLGMLARTLALERALGDAEVGARALAPVLADTDAGTDLVGAVALTAGSVPGTLTVTLPDGTRFGPRTANDADFEAAAGGRAARVASSDGWRVLVPVVRADGAAVVEVAVPGSVARAGVVRAWALLAVLALLLVAGAVLVADRLGRTTVVAVGQLGAVAERLGRGELDARADVDDPPEVAALARSLHTLADRIRRLLAVEREAAADLSHRIRTPLMALRLDVEALPAHPARERLADDLDALERAVDAAIRDARRVGRDDRLEPVDLADLVRARAAFWSVLAEDQGRRLDLDVVDTPAIVSGQHDELATALDALLGNVFAHTPEGSALALLLRVEPDGYAIVVDDAGPGLPDAMVLDRGVSEAGSTGLGLDIARRAVESSGGTLRWGRSPAGGARICLLLPRADAQGGDFTRA